MEPLTRHRREARLDLEVVAELVPADLDIDPHHQVGPCGVRACGAAPLLPATFERQPREHRRFTGSDGRAADRGQGAVAGGIPQLGEHVDAAQLEFGGLRVLVLVDHVLVEALRHQSVGLGLHPRRDERGQVQPGVPVEHQMVVHDLVGGCRIHRTGRKPVLRHSRRLPGPGEHRVHRELIRQLAAAVAVHVQCHRSSIYDDRSPGPLVLAGRAPAALLEVRAYRCVTPRGSPNRSHTVERITRYR